MLINGDNNEGIRSGVIYGYLAKSINLIVKFVFDPIMFFFMLSDYIIARHFGELTL